MKDRLAEFLKAERLTAVKFAEIMEVQPSSISHLLSGRNKPNFEFISRILLRFPNLNPNWIINGQGEIYKSNTKKSTEENTSVKRDNVTTVNNVAASQTNQGSAFLEPVSGGDLFNQPAESPDIAAPVGSVTNVIIQNEQLELKKGLTDPKEELPEKKEKKIARVIVFFTDGSFDEYHN